MGSLTADAQCDLEVKGGSAEGARSGDGHLLSAVRP